ncbi:MAG: hypothetical protein WC666_04300 [Candidatus Paceibacterota bacterium]
MKNPSIASDNKVSEGQIEACVTLVTDATRKGTGTVLRELVKNGVLNKQNIEGVRARGNEVVAEITKIVKKKFAEIAKGVFGIVKLISGAEALELGETDGKATIVKAEGTFPGWIDLDFKEYGCDVESEPTEKVQVSVCEMIKGGTFAQVFNGMSDDLISLCLTQPQIIQFVQKHRKWLRKDDGYTTLFLLKVDNNVFVVYVLFGDDGLLKAGIFRYSHNVGWSVRSNFYFVVPRRALVN